MELNKSAKRYHIPLTFKSKGGKLLHYQFAPPQERMQVPGVPPECHPTEQDEIFWNNKSTVYRNKCIQLLDSGDQCSCGLHTGQTGRPLHTGIKGHERAFKNSD